MDRVRVVSGAPWEGRVGYSRAVRAGALVYVSGTAATTMVEVRRLIAPDLLVEVEAEAVLERDVPGS